MGHLYSRKSALCTLTAKVENLEKNEKKVIERKPEDKRRTFLSFGKKKKKSKKKSSNVKHEENNSKPMVHLLTEQSKVLEPLMMDETEEAYNCSLPFVDEPASVITESDRYEVENLSLCENNSLVMELDEIQSPDVSAPKELVLEKVDSVDDSVLQSWVANVVSAAAEELFIDKSTSGEKNAKLVAQRMIFRELENNKNTLFTNSQYKAIASSTANLIVTALKAKICKEKVTLLAISHAIWGVLASKDSYEEYRKNEVLDSLGTLFTDADISLDGSSFTLPTWSKSFNSSVLDSTILESKNEIVKYNTITDFFDACLGKVDILVDGSTTLSDDIDTLEYSSIMYSGISLINSESLTDTDGYSTIFENREVTVQEFREEKEVRDQVEVALKAQMKKSRKGKPFKKSFAPFQKKWIVLRSK